MSPELLFLPHDSYRMSSQYNVSLYPMNDIGCLCNLAGTSTTSIVQDIHKCVDISITSRLQKGIIHIDVCCQVPVIRQ